MEQALAQPKYSLKAGWICLSIASLLLLLLGPFLGSILAGPLIIASFILAIIGMAKNNVGGGVTLLILSFILPPLALLLSVVLAFALPSVKSSTTETKPVSKELAEP